MAIFKHKNVAQQYLKIYNCSKEKRSYLAQTKSMKQSAGRRSSSTPDLVHLWTEMPMGLLVSNSRQEGKGSCTKHQA